MTDSRKGTVHGIAAFIPGLRYRKALQVPLNPLDPYDDHLKVIPGQEYPRWLKNVHPNYTPYIELMDYEFEVKPKAGIKWSEVTLWAIPNQFTASQQREVVCVWVCTTEFLAVGEPWSVLLREGITRRVK